MIFAWLVLDAPMAADPRNVLLVETSRLAPVVAMVPVIGIVCGLSPALSVRTSDAVRVPVADAEGLKTMSRSQPIDPSGTGALQGPMDEIWNSAALGPVIAALLTVSATSP